MTPASFELAARLLAALLALCPPPAAVRARIDARREQIVADAAEASERAAVPVGVLLVTGFLETHLGTDPREGGGWGAPVSRRQRHVAGTAHHAARALARGRRACGTWRAGVRFYRTGLCAREPARGYTAAYALRLLTRVHARAGEPAPPP